MEDSKVGGHQEHIEADPGAGVSTDQIKPIFHSADTCNDSCDLCSPLRRAGSLFDVLGASTLIIGWSSMARGISRMTEPKKLSSVS